MVALGLLTIFI